MAKIAFLLLCHKDPQAIIRQATTLTAEGDAVAIHFDARAPDAAFAEIEAATKDNPDVALVRRRIKCGWGEWSLVKATLAAARLAFDSFPRATHFYLISGDCGPVKSAAYAHETLGSQDIDRIESVDFHSSGWIRTGLQDERLIYRHWVNERTRRRLFYALLFLQKTLGLKRAIPADLEIMIGSQWWCLRRATIEKILAFADRRRDVVRFFSTTWIPDETFFQTLVRHLVPREEIESKSPTFLAFTDYGFPATFYDDHYDLLISQDCLFARKTSPEAAELRTRLETLWGSGQRDFPIAGDGRRLFDFLTQRGRVGRRFAPRFWETANTLGHDRELLVLVCKKYHVAKRLAGALRNLNVVPAVDYLFDEDASVLPDLGGIESSLAKRGRHRRALLRLVFEGLGTDRLAICLDPSRYDLLEDLYDDRATVKTLLIDCDMDAGYLEGHAERLGLIGAETPRSTVEGLIPSMLQDVTAEMERIRDMGQPDIHRIAEGMPADAIAAVLQEVFEVTPEIARALAETPFLFAD